MFYKSKIERILNDNIDTSNARMKISIVNGNEYYIGEMTNEITGYKDITTYRLDDAYVVLTIETYCDSGTEIISKVYIPYEHIASIAFTKII